jgi:sirohydrochlorin ferrochelatase
VNTLLQRGPTNLRASRSASRSPDPGRPIGMSTPMHTASGTRSTSAATPSRDDRERYRPAPGRRRPTAPRGSDRSPSRSA